MFQRSNWFAWFPVMVSTPNGKRLSWIETIMRERAWTENGAGPWRYYAYN